MAFDITLLQNQEKKEAHLRRADKFMDWLCKPEYGYMHYADFASNENLARLITKLIIWAFEYSMPEGDWQLFDNKFREVRTFALDVPPQDGDTEEQHYNKAVQMLVATLLEYRAHINDIYIPPASQ